MIYFLKHPEGRIKIGTTIRLSQRLKQLAAEYGDGLEVLAVIDGSYDVERGLHDRFMHLRTVGEWFEPGDDLVGFIVSDGKPWDGSDEVEPAAMVRLTPDLVAKARYLAAERGITLTRLLSDLLRPAVEREFRKAAKPLMDDQKRSEGTK